MNSVPTHRDFNHAMKLIRLLLLPMGLWPTTSKIYQRLVRPVAITVCLLTMLAVVISLCLFIALPGEDLKIRLSFIGPLGFALMSLFKYVAVIYQVRKLAECIWNMSFSWQELRNDREHKVMTKNTKTGKLLIAICVLLMYGSGMPYATMLPLSKTPVMHGNDSLWALKYSGYLFQNLQVNTVYNSIFTLHCMCGLVRYIVTCGIYSILILFIMHISSQINITNMMLDKLVENFDYKILGQIISQHRRLLKLAFKLEDTFNTIFFFEVFGSSCIIYSFGYYLITEYEKREAVALLKYFLVLLSFVFNISMLCYIGEILTEQYGSIGRAAYRTEWYRLSRKEAKNLILLIMTTQRPVYLTAGKLFNLSMLTLSNIIKTVATYVNILGTLLDNSITRN